MTNWEYNNSYQGEIWDYQQPDYGMPSSGFVHMSLVEQPIPRMTNHQSMSRRPHHQASARDRPLEPLQPHRRAHNTSRRDSDSTNSTRHSSSSESSPTIRSGQITAFYQNTQSTTMPMSIPSPVTQPRIELLTSPNRRPTERYYCDYADCIDSATGKRRSLGRKADLKRHMNSVHGKPFIDCKYPRCSRRDDEGFRREDHYREHLKGFHLEGTTRGR